MARGRGFILMPRPLSGCQIKGEIKDFICFSTSIGSFQLKPVGGSDIDLIIRGRGKGQVARAGPKIWGEGGLMPGSLSLTM